MEFPRVEIKPGDSIEEAEARVEGAYRALQGEVRPVENLNTFLPISPYCHFFQAKLAGRELVLVVTVRPWDEGLVLTVLNVLLEIRMDPDPPGQTPLFRLYSPDPVPAVLLTMFGDSRVSDLECRAALVAHFGRDLTCSRSLQLAAVGMALARESLGISTSFLDGKAEEVLAQAVVGWLRAENLPEDGAPLNSLIVLGFFYGEVLRQRFGYPSTWVRLREPGARDPDPWPVLTFAGHAGHAGHHGKGQAGRSTEVDAGAAGDADAADAADADASAAIPGAPRRVVFSPVAVLISLYKEGEASQLLATSAELERRLREDLEAVPEAARRLAE